MSELKALTQKILKFRNNRDWKQFHNPKDMAISLVLEASEVLEHTQWKSKEELEEYIKTHKKDIGEELCDVLYWVLLMSHDLKIDLLKQFEEKMAQNEKKYPIKKVKGKHKKYNQY